MINSNGEDNCRYLYTKYESTDPFVPILTETQADREKERKKALEKRIHTYPLLP